MILTFYKEKIDLKYEYTCIYKLQYTVAIATNYWQFHKLKARVKRENFITMIT